MPPELDLDTERRLQTALLAAIRKGLVKSSHDLSLGGLALALLTSSTDELGVHMDLQTEMKPESAFFSETQSRAIIGVSPDLLDPLEDLMHQNQVLSTRVGVVMPGRFDLALNGRILIEEDLPGLRDLWLNGLERIMNSMVADNHSHLKAA